MILFLVRHGFSHANEKLLVTGTPNDSLTPGGRNQAEALSEWFSDHEVLPERFMVSHWSRARETANICFPEATWMVDARLGETDAGSAASLLRSDFLRDDPFFYDNPANVYPNGESHLDLNIRVLDWLRTQLGHPCKSLVAVAHSGPISCLLQYVLKIEMASFPAFIPKHATVSVIQFSRQNGAWKGKLKAFSIGPKINLMSMLHGQR